ncbi:MAG: UDP-glucose/GDP-mannose dehydrogenase family protein [Armatimonadota bacterium]|nr:UDP-glucose/GDP-mannose dehydrogenase family protein [Armatimonadota bacterium]MDR5697877.1 UDP-glucose/GDP-mannose dehydrogenase family protein [Armatimonadota bacterium]
MDSKVAALRGTALRPVPVAVIGGAGYVGTITAAGLAHLGHLVRAFDVNEERIEMLRGGFCPFLEPDLPELLHEQQRSGRLVFTPSLPEALAEAAIVFVAVNTPRRSNGEADLSHVIEVALRLARQMNRHFVVAVKSTVPVGSHAAIRRVFERSGLREGSDYDLVATPEFLREGHAVSDFFFPDRVVVGADSADARAMVRELFEPLQAPILETTIENAQMIKYAANAFLAMRISFINEVANICERVGADVEVVAQGIGYDRRIGHDYLRPGVGFGGPCLPKDLEGLIRLSEDAGYEPYFLKAVLEKNQHQRREILAKVHALLGPSLYDRRIAVLGLTFKPNTSDVRNSTASVLVDRLVRRGAEVTSYDPGLEAADVEGRVVRNPYEAAADADLLLLATAWPQFRELDYGRIRTTMRSPNIVDAVNLLDPASMRRLGFTYLSVGRP